MKHGTLLLSLACAGLLLAACQEQEIALFDREEAGIYFHYNSGAGSSGQISYSDSLPFSFGSVKPDVMEHPIAIPVRAMGKVKDYPRPARVLLDEERTTATRGFHYEVDLEAVVIAAGESSTFVRLRLFRTPDLLDQKYHIAFKLEENEHFRLHVETRKNSNLHSVAGTPVDMTRLRVTMREEYSQPWYWRYYVSESYGGFFGAWTPRKYAFVNALAGWTDTDWANAGNASSMVALGRFGYISTLVQKALQKLADEGNPMREADGSLMQLAGIYVVDYSAYE
jgi:hypothetical protein